MEHKILDRSQQDPANCWALEDLYATPADWERDLAELKDLTGKLARILRRLHDLGGPAAGAAAAGRHPLGPAGQAGQLRPAPQR